VPAKDFHPLDQSFSHYFQDGVGCEMSQATMPGVQVCGRGNFAASADSGTSEYSPSVGSRKMPSGATRKVGGLSTSTQSVQAATQLAFVRVSEPLKIRHLLPLNRTSAPRFVICGTDRKLP